MDNREIMVRFPRGEFFFQKLPDLLSPSPSLLLWGYQGIFFPWREEDTYLRLLTRLRMCGDISLLPSYASMARTAVPLPYREIWEMIPERLRPSHSIRLEKASHSTLYTGRLASHTWPFLSLPYLYGLRKDQRQTQCPPLTLNGKDLTVMTIRYTSKQ